MRLKKQPVYFTWQTKASVSGAQRLSAKWTSLAYCVTLATSSFTEMRWIKSN